MIFGIFSAFHTSSPLGNDYVGDENMDKEESDKRTEKQKADKVKSELYLVRIDLGEGI